jgi:hypothetical protein
MERYPVVGPKAPPSVEIGTEYKDRKGRLCRVVDIYKTFNHAGELVSTSYVVEHEFMGQMVTEKNVCKVTIQRAIQG